MIKMHCYDRSSVPVLWRKCLSCRRDCHTVIISYKWALPSCLPARQVVNEPEMFCWRLTQLEFWYDLIVNENQMVKYETCCLTLLMTMAQWSHIFWFNPCIDILSMLTLLILYFYWSYQWEIPTIITAIGTTPNYKSARPATDQTEQKYFIGCINKLETHKTQGWQTESFCHPRPRPTYTKNKATAS